MYPIAFSIGSIDIYWYGILMGCTFVSAYLIARYFARFHGVDEQKIEISFLSPAWLV